MTKNNLGVAHLEKGDTDTAHELIISALWRCFDLEEYEDIES